MTTQNRIAFSNEELCVGGEAGTRIKIQKPQRSSRKGAARTGGEGCESQSFLHENPGERNSFPRDFLQPAFVDTCNDIQEDAFQRDHISDRAMTKSEMRMGAASRRRHSGGSEKTWSVRGEGAINPGKVNNKSCRARGEVNAVLRPRSGRVEGGGTTLKG